MYGYDEHTKLTKWDRIRFAILETPYWLAIGVLGFLNLFQRT